MQFLNKKKIELFQKLEYGRQSMFLLNKKKNNLISFFVEQPINFKKSVMNNYYQGDILSRLSTTLSLCSKKYVVYNDYKFDIEL
jgi:hypothetical protein